VVAQDTAALSYKEIKSKEGITNSKRHSIISITAEPHKAKYFSQTQANDKTEGRERQDRK
jgi:hypothetical protein